MSIVAVTPATNMIAGNEALAEQGFGPSNFSVAAFTGSRATHAALHAWHDPAFSAAVKAIAGVVWEPGAYGWVVISGTPQIPEPPQTPEWAVGVLYSVNDQVTYGGQTYKCLQAHTSQAGWTPAAVPALWGEQP